MQDQQEQFTLRLKETKNVLVTVSNNPSVDQLAAAIGLTLALNRMDKHATAVFSGEAPSTIQFLRPEDTLEKTTDSLRDFIIALDKTKADKLRYKVEDQVVRIFITPYHTALSEKDLDFSQGDFNVDTVIALGIQDAHDIDTAVQAHGQILHNATVMTMALQGPNELGSINWVDTGASSLSEMALRVIESLDKETLDGQIATSLLTGIVAMTERFSNDRTSPQTMNASATLMAAGANQQLITSELETPPAPPKEEPAPIADAEGFPDDGNPSEAPSDSGNESGPNAPSEPGVLEIEHEGEGSDGEEPAELPAVVPTQQIHVDENGHLSVLDHGVDSHDTTGTALSDQPKEPKVEVRRERMDEAPSFSNQLTANTEPDLYSPPTEQLTQPTQDTPILHHDQGRIADSAPVEPAQPPAPFPLPEVPAPEMAANPDDHKTLAEIEESVHSPHTEYSDEAPAPKTPFVPPTPATPAAPSAFPGVPVVKEDDNQPAPPPVPPPYIPPTE